MNFRIVLEDDADAQAFSAVCPELPGCASAGDTEEEAKQNIKEAIELYLTPSDLELWRNAKVEHPSNFAPGHGYFERHRFALVGQSGAIGSDGTRRHRNR